ncbi:MAG: DUF3592 domain-containing protein [Anaerolineae bacterium]|nr:DUF3592 domain-containing protein [Anaerolineae bacterium]
MNENTATDSFALLKGLRQLESSDPAERKHAVMVLSSYQDDTRVRDVLRYTADTDPDPGVCALARQHVLRTAQPTTESDPFSQHSSGQRKARSRSVAGPAWMCKFCRTENITGDVCPNCGADRASGQASAKERRRARAASGNWMASEQPFLFHPGNRRFLQGKSRGLSGTATGGLIAVLLVLVLAMVGLFVVVGIPHWLQARELDRSGVITQGTVIERDIHEDDEGSDTYYVRYSFVAGDGRAYERQQQVSRSNYSNWARGATVRVKYLTGDPAVSRLVDDNTADSGSRIVLIISVVAIALVMIFVVLAVDQRSRNRRLASKGQLLRGEVLVCTGHKDSDGDYFVTLRYCFLSPEDREITARDRRLANDLKHASLPAPGTAVAVLYADDDTYKVL